MNRLALVFVLLAASSFAQSLPNPTVPACDPSPADAVRYTVLLAGNRAGLEISSIAADKSIHTCFEFTDRGRGPRFRTEYRLGHGGIPVSVHTTGNDYLKSPVDEQFSFENGQANWSNKAEDDRRPLSTPAFYVSMNGPAQESAFLVRGLLASPKRTLPLLPAGQATAERIRDLDVTVNAQKKRLTLYSISGLAFSPSYVWLDETNAFFAQVSGYR